ncbi:MULTISPECIES: uracil-DNA glycosylase [Alphaproteobacteria]|uniref:uracil-DNA glycosylase n=1 Tax=Alphaproteobacteria TaxID=28211 RepID=UPI0019D3FCBF|nr:MULTISPECIES: uracil-DNA glycosylase [Alphaproteobacteria]MBY6020754.1 uracil-DNA glycosylase [Nitratireductor sp. DP7N14-4]MBN7755968.1 uracil-DNA glycosylase [Nitratireductor aquimarinus]MBN7762512.1 uracil-DNA glycosylase [Nitratireductor aquibiodomus]MBY5998726.1 uracil-DNA glycosylase [Tritonibacter mobilis]MCV0348766.1 uracil-DNA glycosylase [Nitratireductor sp.]
MDSAGLRELLTFYADAGVDESLLESAADRFEETRVEAEKRAARRAPAAQEQKKKAPAAQIQAPPLPSSQRAAIPDDAQAARAREIAKSANTLEELREQLAAFDGCNLKTTAKNTVFSDGNPQAAVMLVGEAPGRDEDLQGLPFVGRSGKLLDRMLAAIGLDRTSVYISNVIPWRPPGNRDPSPLETEICRPFIERHIELVAPKVLVTLGNPSTKLLLNTQTGIMRMRGNWALHKTPGGQEIPTMPTLHPAYLLRNPAHKKLAWHDLLAIKVKLEGAGA